MKTLKSIHVWLKGELALIHLVDKFLIMFMAVLLAQSAYSLFTNLNSDSKVNDVDVIIRTSSAAIFGYFLSANFRRHTPSGKKRGPTDEQNRDVTANSIGKQPVPGPEPDLLHESDAKRPDNNGENDPICNLQVAVTACIGMFCIFVLILLRDAAGWNAGSAVSPSASATVAQFRDFVSGCVGFLIGCPTSGRDNKD